jgi:queuosine precursor transporter
MLTTKEKSFPKMLAFLLMFLAILFFIPDVLVYKIIKIGPIEESAAILFFPIVYSIADAITEVYGRKIALFSIFSCYVLTIFFSMIIKLVIHLPSPHWWVQQKAFETVFDKGLWVVFAGIVSVTLSMYVNVRFMSQLKAKLRGKHFIIRSITSSSIGELIVTGIAYPMLFFHLHSGMLILMLNAYIFKLAYSIVGAFPAKYLVFLLREIDGVKQEVYNEDFHNLALNKL